MVLEPGPPGQSVRIRKSALALQQFEIQLGQRGSSQRGPAVLSCSCIEPLVVIGAPIESIQRILQRREIEMGWHCFHSGCHRGLLGVRRGAKSALADLAVTFADLIALIFRQALKFIYIIAHSGKQIGEIERQ